MKTSRKVMILANVISFVFIISFQIFKAAFLYLFVFSIIVYVLLSALALYIHIKKRNTNALVDGSKPLKN